MEQNRLKELILSMRKSKHNMFKKVADFALAVEDKGVIDMDTHKLASIMKDAFTKRRKKELYADILSNIIGGSSSEEPATQAPIFKALRATDSGTSFDVIDWQLGSQATYDADEMVPYAIYLTEDQASKFLMTVECSDQSIFEDLSGESGVRNIDPDPHGTNVITQNAGDFQHYAFGYMLGYVNLPEMTSTLGPTGYLRFTITYDGVDYVYLS